MNPNELRAIVIGAGWAGEGHTKALQRCGVEVAAICARNQQVVQAVADRLNVPLASTDWRATLTTIKPDIVSLATPAVLRAEVIEAAVTQGCHILCEKPLAVDASTAKHLYQLVANAGVKHALGTTLCYAPCCAWAAELIQNKAIGELRAIHVTQIAPLLPPILPWSWMMMVEMGGGILNNTHLFAQLERIVGGRIRRVTGSVSHTVDKAPVVPDYHDFRQIFMQPITAEAAAQMEWRACNPDSGFRTLLECTTHNGGRIIPISIHFDSASPIAAPTNGWYFLGTEGVLVGDGPFAFTLSQRVGDQITDLPVPERLLSAIPQTGNELEDVWTSWVDDVVADIRQEGTRVYPDFEDGWRYQQVIDAIRSGQGWQEIGG